MGGRRRQPRDVVQHDVDQVAKGVPVVAAVVLHPGRPEAQPVFELVKFGGCGIIGT